MRKERTSWRSEGSTMRVGWPWCSVARKRLEGKAERTTGKTGWSRLGAGVVVMGGECSGALIAEWGVTGDMRGEGLSICGGGGELGGERLWRANCA